MNFFFEPIQFYLKKLYAWVLPYTCILCGSPSQISLDICLPCLEELPILPQSCPRCANTLPSKTDLCKNCQANPPPFDKTHALFSYEPPISKLLLDLKFQNTLLNAKILGELMAISIKTEWYEHGPLPNLILPVPLHTHRLKQRGFNQAVELAKPIAKRLNLPLSLDACIRSKHTLPQATLKAEDRTQNIQQAFKVEQNITGLHIAIVDDVITTGQTVTELTNVLKSAGAYRVDVWCCAKALFV
jgi:ComF family protein